MNLKDTNQFVKERGILLPNGQVILQEPLFVFKRVNHFTTDYSDWNDVKRPAIANLVIPIGAVVSLAQSEEKKLRANQAYCFSIVNKDTKRELAEACSTYDRKFKYISGKHHGLEKQHVEKLAINAEEYVSNKGNWSMTRKEDIIQKALKKCKVVPSGFDSMSITCSTGIHFFLEVRLALNY